MRNIRDKSLTWSALNQRFGRSDPVGFWEILATRIGMSDVRWAKDRQAIVFPEYIPVETIVADLLQEVDRGNMRLAPCAVCGQWHDGIRDPGIYSDPAGKGGFICRACAGKMSAWEFYHDHLLD